MLLLLCSRPGHGDVGGQLGAVFQFMKITLHHLYNPCTLLWIYQYTMYPYVILQRVSRKHSRERWVMDTRSERGWGLAGTPQVPEPECRHKGVLLPPLLPQIRGCQLFLGAFGRKLNTVCLFKMPPKGHPMVLPWCINACCLFPLDSLTVGDKPLNCLSIRWLKFGHVK